MAFKNILEKIKNRKQAKKEKEFQEKIGEMKVLLDKLESYNKQSTAFLKEKINDGYFYQELDSIISCVKNGGNPNIQSANGDTFLIFAAAGGFFNFAKELIENDADVNIQNSDGFTALMEAIVCENFEIAKLLIEKNALVDLKNQRNHGAIKIAKECAIISNKKSEYKELIEIIKDATKKQKETEKQKMKTIKTNKTDVEHSV